MKYYTLYITFFILVFNNLLSAQSIISSKHNLSINKGEGLIEEISDKEEDFIDRAINPRLNSRLGCQCVLIEDGGEIDVTLPDQTQFLGE